MIPNTKFMTSLIETLVESGLGLSSEFGFTATVY